MTGRNSAARVALGLIVAVVALLASASIAAAHVTIDSATANADGTVTLTFAFDHGCGLSPTVELRVRLPEAATVVETSQPPGWSAEPGPDHSLRWTGPPIASGDRVIFGVTTNRFGQAGEIVWFPTVQRCEVGEYAWIDTDSASETPSPFVVLDTATAAVAPPAVAPPVISSGAPSGATTAQVTLIIALAVAGASGGAALFGRRARRSRIDG